MAKIVNLLGCLFVSLPFAYGQANDGAERLASLFNQLRDDNNAHVVCVQYTGGDFEKAGGGFLWQNRDGKGWTKGERIKLTNAKSRQIDRVVKCFELIAENQYVSGQTYKQGELSERCVSGAGGQKVYAYRYEPRQNVLYFLQATPGEGCCVPMNWYCRDTVDATVVPVVRHDPFARFTPVERRLLGLSRLWAGVKQNFVFMSRINFNWDSVYVANIERVKNASSDEECTRIFQQMAALLHDGHTYVYDYSQRPSEPVTTKYIDGHVYVDAVLDKGLVQSGIKRGMELISIDGKPVLEYGRLKVMPYVSSSTSQWTIHSTYENSALTACGFTDDTMHLEFEWQGKRVFTDYTPGNSQPLTVRKPQVEWEKLKGNIGYIRISHFGTRPGLFDKIYPELLKTKALILDLRGNPGGNSGNADYILRHLATDTFQLSSWSSPMYIPALVSWGYPVSWHNSAPVYQYPVEGVEPYTQPVVVLVDRGTFSAAEDFCAVFRGMKRGILIGTPTAGSTGNGVRIELIPGKNYANICSKHDIAPDGTDFVGKGIIPDIIVEESYQTFFEDKKDAALTAALQYLENLENR